jgi:predicted nucleic acid-binding protein
MRNKPLANLCAFVCVALTLIGSAFDVSGQAQTIYQYNKAWRFNTNGTDLGATWRATNYNDSSWGLGTGVFSTAGETLLQGATIGTTLVTTNTATLRFVTNFLFRTTFVLTNPGPGFYLLSSNLIDDGAVFYLNSVEVARVSMPTGAITANTLATRGSDVATYGVDVVYITNAIVNGTNHLAVEVHQNSGTSSDIVWGQKLMLLPPIIITNQPTSQLVPPGATAVFNVVAGGVTPLSYQWQKDGTNLPGQTAATLSIPNAQVANAGSYRVILSNSVNGVSATLTSAIATLTVNCTTVGITSHPTNQTVNAGNTVTISVTATGATPIVYQWYKDAVRITGATNASYVLNPALMSDSGTYHVAVTNCGGGFLSSNAVLTVNCVPVAVTAQPANIGVNAGSPFTLAVTVSGSPLIGYQWYKNNSPISGATNTTYTKASAVVSDSAQYFVTMTNCAGTVYSRTAVVAVADAPYTLVHLTNTFWKYEQSGNNLSGTFHTTNYSDAAWPSGRGILAYEDGNAFVIARTNTVLTLSNETSRIITYYFRTHFTLTNDPRTVSVIASNIFDDGMVVYLNGSEIYRLNMPAGAVTSATLASGAAAEGVFVVTNFPPDKLIQGDNLLAVELHQVNATSSDVVMGMHVIVEFPTPSLLVITNQPTSLSIEETKAATFTLGLSGFPAFYQWYKDGVAISNGTSNPFTIPVASTNDSGTYYVIATNIINSVTSAVVALTVYPDTNAPTLVEADGSLALTNVLVTFSELINATNATNRLNYSIYNTLGGTINVSQAVLTNGTNVLLTTDARTGVGNYILVVNGIRDVSPRQNLIATNSSIPISTVVNIFPLTGAVWDFTDPAYDAFGEKPDQGTVWRLPGFDITNPTNGLWGSAPSPFYYFSNPAQIIDIPFDTAPGTALSQADPPFVTSYFRKSFHFAGSPGGTKISIRHYTDDGAIFWFNGNEALRFNMPTGAIDYLGRAATAVGNGVLTDPIYLPAEFLTTGTNLLAVELHQFATADLDKVFTAQMDAKVLSLVTGPVVITSGPLDQTVFEGQSATFSVVQAGGRTFQWQLNSNNISGGTNYTYSTPPATMAMDGNKYRVVVTGITNSATSTNATLRVLADTNAPTLVSGYASSNSTITITFSEAVTAATANNVTNYVVTNSLGQILSVSSAALTNGTNVVLSFASLPYATYTVFVSNVRDTSTAGNMIVPNSAVIIGYGDVVVAWGGTWRYNQDGVDQRPFGWYERAFDDLDWPSGAGIFDAKEGGRGANPWPYPILTPNPPLLVPTNGPGGVYLTTTYFRGRFNSYAGGAGSLTFRTILDDGAVIYLNGVEIYRIRMAAGTPAYATQANANVGNAVLEGPFSVDVTNLLGGENVIAVEVHQNGGASSDLTWGGEFSIFVASQVLPTPECVQIISQPQGRTNGVGANVQLNVVASGAAPIYYQWRKDGTNIAGATNNLLVFNPAQTTNSGVYSVLVNNLLCSVLSSNATVLITNACSGVAIVEPKLWTRFSGTNLVLYWTNPPADTCGNPAVFNLQRASAISNASTLWTTITNPSPFTNGMTNGIRFYRLQKP